MTTFFKENRKVAAFFLALLLLLAAEWLTYRLFGHRLLQAMYEGRAPGLLAGIMEGQRVHSLQVYLEHGDQLFASISLAIPLFLAILLILFRPRLMVTSPPSERRLEAFTDSLEAIPDSHVGFWIALAAGLTLYTELMIIRVHASYFQLFAYFKNVSLLSCFLGLGIGYARGSRRPLTTPLILPCLVLQISLMYLLRLTPLAGILRSPISEQLTLGLKQAGEIGHVAVVYLFLIFIYAFNTLCFIPLGHLASRLMLRRQQLVAYSWNLLGSLAGILLFSVVSFLWAPPSVWLLLAGVGVLLFFRHDVGAALPSIGTLALGLTLLALPFRLTEFDVYSPYQILSLRLSPDEAPVLETSNVYFQRILDLRADSVRGRESLEAWGKYYNLPYRFKPRPERVLIVGSGTGNDVAAAIRNAAGEIDAVEIDPAIVDFGRMLHPESPYQARNVHVFVNDARAFLQDTERRYDLIVYGLLDSHTLLSGRSGGIRLDSYVYTVEGLRAARERLREGGMISLSFSVMSPAMGRKLFLMLTDAFEGVEPIAFQVGYDGGYTFLAGAALTSGGRSGDALIGGVSFPPTLRNVGSMFADSAIRADKSTDDWPFFYMPVKRYPLSYFMMILLLLAVSAGYVRAFVPGAGGGFSFPCFFLGAGFMLVETKGITELARVYGSTWIVISVVISCILIMAFFANLLVMRMRTPPPVVTYGLLFVSLVAGLGLTFADLGGAAPWVVRAITTSVLTLPLFFAGFAFSAELAKAKSMGIALSSNLFGAMLGGFLEYNSMYFGFRSLYVFALAMYGMAFVSSLRETGWTAVRASRGLTR